MVLPFKDRSKAFANRSFFLGCSSLLEVPKKAWIAVEEVSESDDVEEQLPVDARTKTPRRSPQLVDFWGSKP